MRYIFKILVLGNFDVLIPYLSTAFNEIGEDKETYEVWNREITVLEDICEIEIDAITKLTADFDQLIPSVDGIIYFLNPLINEEIEYFQMILDILEKIKRNIPTVILYYNEDGILPISVIDLLEDTWIDYPDFEAFINVHPRYFKQVLQSLSFAMISGDDPLDLENAWLRYPVLVMQANYYYNKKDFYNAGKIIKKIAFINSIFNRENNYIINEQAAYLFSKIELYQETANILSQIDTKKSMEYKKLYVKAMIREGNKLFNKADYKYAARQYENAAQWALIELKDKKLIIECFKLAINSWISACEVENAFTILERLPHEEIKPILQEVADKVIAASDYLVSQGDLKGAREEIYIAINTYQRENLLEIMKKFAIKLSEILIQLLKDQIKKHKINGAKRSYDEILNLWTYFEVRRGNLDLVLEGLIIQFLDKLNFKTAVYLINELNSLKLKKKLTEYSSQVEDKNKLLKKRDKEININQGIQILINFIETENEIINTMNSKKLENAIELIEKNQYIRAADQLEKYVDYLKNLGEINEADRILCELLDILVQGNQIEEFLKYYPKITGIRVKKNYIKYIFPFLIDSFNKINKNYKYEKNEKIFEDLNLILRNQMLYEQSKEISNIFIEIIRNEALKIVKMEQNTIGIEGAINLIKKVANISSSYLDNKEFHFDEVYQIIADIYINLGDLSSALSNIDKIVEKTIKKEAYKKLAKQEDTKILLESKRIEASLKVKLIKEKSTDIKMLAEDAKSDMVSKMKQRKGFKRAFFEKALYFLNEKKYNNALELYENSIVRMEKTKQYYLAGVSIAIMSLILIRDDKKDELIKFIEEKSYSDNFYHNSFPVILVEYLTNLIKIKKELEFNETLLYMENLPLFTEERELLYDILNKTYPKEPEFKEIKRSTKSKVTGEDKGKTLKKILELDQKIDILQQKLRDHKSIFQEVYKKRNALKKRYYNELLSLLENDKYREAADKYYELVNIFSKRKDYENSTLLLLLHVLSLIRTKSSLNEIKNVTQDYLNTLGTSKAIVSEIFQFDILLLIIDVFSNKYNKFIPKINEMLENLPLFEEEWNLLPITL